MAFVVAALMLYGIAGAQQQPQRPQLTQQQLESLQQMLGNLTEPGQQPWQLSGFDLVQNNDIAALKNGADKIEKHLDAVDGTVQANGREQSASDARDGVWNTILSGLVLALIGDRVYMKKQEGQTK